MAACSVPGCHSNRPFNMCYVVLLVVVEIPTGLWGFLFVDLFMADRLNTTLSYADPLPRCYNRLATIPPHADPPLCGHDKLATTPPHVDHHCDHDTMQLSATMFTQISQFCLTLDVNVMFVIT